MGVIFFNNISLTKGRFNMAEGSMAMKGLKRLLGIGGKSDLIPEIPEGQKSSEVPEIPEVPEEPPVEGQSYTRRGWSKRKKQLDEAAE
jgi:hypothetical protein